MENNVNPTPQQAAPQPSPTPGNGNNTKTVIIVIAAVVVIIAGYMIFSRWRAQRAVQGMLNDMGIQAGGEMMLGDLADDSSLDDANLTPEQKFAKAEAIEIGDSVHQSIADEIGKAIKAVYGDYKITSFVSGYMGMNSGSGITQYTVPQLLSTNDATQLASELEDGGMTIIANLQEDEAVSIMAQKDDFTYTIGYNADEQEITSIAIKGMDY
jgi:hypothetical protein